MYTAECCHPNDSMNIAVVLNEHRWSSCSTTVILTCKPYPYDILKLGLLAASRI